MFQFDQWTHTQSDAVDQNNLNDHEPLTKDLEAILDPFKGGYYELRSNPWRPAA